MSEVKWIKINIDMFDDEKIKIIQAMPEGDALLIVWIKLITLAGKTNDGGYIYIAENMPYTDEMLSVIMNKPISTIRLALATFKSMRMIENDNKGIYLVNFEKHQSLEKLEKLKEQNRLRVAKYRENKKQELLKCNADVTLQVMQGNALDKDIEEDKDIDKENKERKNFKQPTIEEIEQYCEERNNGINANAFYDFYESKNWYVGKNKMKDWKACIRTWEQRNIKQEKTMPKWFNEEIKNEEQELDEEGKKLYERLINGSRK